MNPSWPRGRSSRQAPFILLSTAVVSAAFLLLMWSQPTAAQTSDSPDDGKTERTLPLEQPKEEAEPSAEYAQKTKHNTTEDRLARLEQMLENSPSSSFDRWKWIMDIAVALVAIFGASLSLFVYRESRKNSARERRVEASEYAIEAWDLLLGEERSAAIYDPGRDPRALTKASQIIEEKALVIDPDNILVLRRQALIKRALGKPGEAIKILHRALSIEPENSTIYLSLGSAYAAADRTSDAIKAYKKSLALDPGNALGYYNLGTLFKKSGNFDEAADAFRKSIVLDPSSWRTHNNLGVALYLDGRFGEAIEAFEKGVELNSDSALLYHNLANARMKLGDDDGAISAYNDSLALDPTYTIDQFFLRPHAEDDIRIEESGGKKWRITMGEKTLVINPRAYGGGGGGGGEGSIESLDVGEDAPYGLRDVR